MLTVSPRVKATGVDSDADKVDDGPEEEEWDPRERWREHKHSAGHVAATANSRRPQGIACSSSRRRNTRSRFKCHSLLIAACWVSHGSA